MKKHRFSSFMTDVKIMQKKTQRDLSITRNRCGKFGSHTD